MSTNNFLSAIFCHVKCGKSIATSVIFTIAEELRRTRINKQVRSELGSLTRF